jgi:hypothetical protein
MPRPTLGLVKLFRRRQVPDAVRAVALPAGDRRLGWALTADGRPVVATSSGLLLPGRDVVAWADVERAAWQRPVLTVVELADRDPRVSGQGRTTTLSLGDDEGGLPDVVHAAVTSSVAWSTHARLEPSGGVRVVGRRRPGAELLDWQAVYDPGTDVHDPRVRAQGDALVRRSSRAIG